MTSKSSGASQEGSPPPKGGEALTGLLKLLDLEVLELNLFRGVSPKDGWQRVFGGQVLGQALVAASRTVTEPRPAHSLHGYFLLGGDPAHPIIYEVERTRDGGSFSTRLVKAIQHGRVIFTMSVSYHQDEHSFDHQIEMPNVPDPESLPSASDFVGEYMDKLPEAMKAYWRRERPVDVRPVNFSRYVSRQPGPPQQYIWLKADRGLPADLAVHQCVLAYASDLTLLDTALVPHGCSLFDADLQFASLDHALWFHRPFVADEWLLYAQDSPSAYGARGFCRGSFFTRDGRLIASAAQEGLVRKRRSSLVIK